MIKYKPGFYSPDVQTFRSITRLSSVNNWQVFLTYADPKTNDYRYGHRHDDPECDCDEYFHPDDVYVYYGNVSELPENYKGVYKPYYVDHNRKFGFRHFLTTTDPNGPYTDIEYWTSHLNDIFNTQDIRVILD